MNMKRAIKISKFLQIGLLLTLFLPFFPSGCESKHAEEVPVQEITDNDLLSSDSVNQLSAAFESDTVVTATAENRIQQTDSTQKGSNDSELSSKLAKKSSILRLLLRPNNNYTGIASLIETFSVFQLGYGLGMACILWVVALVVKFKDFNNIFMLINIIGLVLMFYSHSIANILNDDRLWGFWVCISWSATMIVYDGLLLFRLKKETKIHATL